MFKFTENIKAGAIVIENETGLPDKNQSALDSRSPVSTVIIDAVAPETAPEGFTLIWLDSEGPLEPGRFPADALPSIIRDVAENVAEVYQVDAGIVFMACLAAISGAIGKSVTVEGGVNGRTTPCNLYMIAGAPSGYGKSGVVKVVTPLLEASKQMKQQHSRAELLTEKTQLENRQKKLLKSDSTGDSIKETLEKTIKRLEEIDGLLTYPPTYHVGEITGAALEEALCRNDEQIFSFSAEAGEVIGIALGKYAGRQRGDLNLLLAGFSWDQVDTARISRGFKTLEPCLSLFWMGQPTLLHELYSSNAVLERGLAGRVLAFVAQRDQVPFEDGVERTIDKSVYAAWEQCIHGILESRNQPRSILVLPEARRCFNEWHNDAVILRNGELRDIEGALSRWREQAIRIAGVLAVAAGAEEITEEIATDAIRVCRWSVLNSLKLLEAGRVDRMKKRLGRLHELLSEGAVTVRILANNHGFTKPELKQMAEEYPNRFVFETYKPSTGRPSKKMKLV